MISYRKDQLLRESIFVNDTGDKVQRKLGMLVRSIFDSHGALLFLEILLIDPRNRIVD